MPRYQSGDITCSAIEVSGGKYRAQVRVVGSKLKPPQKDDYIYRSAELFEDKSDAMRHAIEHTNRTFHTD